MDYPNQVPPTMNMPEAEFSNPPPLTPRGQVPAMIPQGSTSPLSTPPSRPSAPKRSMKWLWWSLGGLVTVGILGGGYFAYSKGFLSIPFLTPKSDELFSKMIDSITTITSAQYTVRADIEAQPRGSGKPLFDSATLNTNLPSAGGALALFDPKELFKSIPGDIKVQGGTTIYVETDKLVQDANGLFKIDGTYTGSDTSVAVDLELRKVQQNLYAIVRKFPSFFFFDLSGIKDKWIMITPDDSLADISSSTLESQDLRKSADSLKSATKKALDNKLFTFKQKLAAETIAGVRSEHYLIAIDPTKLPAVLTAIRDEQKAKGQSVTAIEQALTDIQKPEIAKLLQAMADNSKVEIWIDKSKGMLRQIRWGLTVVPDDSVERLKGKQIFVGLTLTLDKVNQKVNIDKPSPTIDFDEATRLVTGITKEQQRFDKQTGRVSKLRAALSMYKTKNQRYPTSLDELNSGLKSIYQQCLKDHPVTNTNSDTTTAVTNTSPGTTSSSNESIANSSGPTSFSIESVGSSIGLGGYDSSLYTCYDEKQYHNGVSLDDVYTAKPYVYTLKGDEYELVYTITLSDAKNSYDADSYIDGKNTATSTDTSVEKTSTLEEQTKKYQDSLNANTNTTAKTTTTTTPSLYSCFSGAPATTRDSDGDKLNDFDEVNSYHSDPCKTDTDGDGFPDGEEVANGYNPLGDGKFNLITVSELKVDIASGQVTASWKTDPISTAKIHWGTSSAYYYGTFSDFLTSVSHTIHFTVEPGKTYHYQIESCLENGTCQKSVDYTIKS